MDPKNSLAMLCRPCVPTTIRSVLSSRMISRISATVTLPNDEFVLNASKSSGSKERCLQLRGLAQYGILTGGDRTRTRHG